MERKDRIPMCLSSQSAAGFRLQASGILIKFISLLKTISTELYFQPAWTVQDNLCCNGVHGFLSGKRLLW
jgi:hypothetical protein